MSICSVEIDVAADVERTFAYLADASNQAAGLQAALG